MGLNYKFHAPVRKGFHNAYLVIVRESGNKEHQKLMLKELIQDILKNDEEKSYRFSVRFIDLICILLEDFCSERVDTKKHLTKKDVYADINFGEFFDQILGMLKKQEIVADNIHSEIDSIITGYFSLLEKIIEVDNGIKNKKNSPE